MPDNESHDSLDSMDSHGASADVTFRPNKRRKIIRRRNVDRSSAPSSGAAPARGDISEQESLVTLPAVKRPISRKHGIAFSSVTGQPPTEAALSGDSSLVPFQPPEDEATSNDRFTKSTGKAEVVEDKHLTAYVDSKLAELRSTTSTPTTRQDQPVNTTKRTPPPTSPKKTTVIPETCVVGVQPIHAPRKNTRRATNRPPRGQRPKDADELAREAMIEQILGESQVPMYDQSSSSSAARVASNSDTGIDNDEAAAEAFKADFLANLALQNRRRPAASSTAAKNAVKGAAPVPSGPKLGGSRAQREKMRAIEEAKNAVGAAKR